MASIGWLQPEPNHTYATIGKIDGVNNTVELYCTPSMWNGDKRVAVAKLDIEDKQAILSAFLKQDVCLFKFDHEWNVKLVGIADPTDV